tara:strand:+ start:5179 stop:6021 length:843 start_codon:yes stop_codon:yes gene_type:complete
MKKIIFFTLVPNREDHLSRFLASIKTAPKGVLDSWEIICVTQGFKGDEFDRISNDPLYAQNVDKTIVDSEELCGAMHGVRTALKYCISAGADVVMLMEEDMQFTSYSNIAAEVELATDKTTGVVQYYSGRSSSALTNKIIRKKNNGNLGEVVRGGQVGTSGGWLMGCHILPILVHYITLAGSRNIEVGDLFMSACLHTEGFINYKSSKCWIVHNIGANRVRGRSPQKIYAESNKVDMDSLGDLRSMLGITYDTLSKLSSGLYKTNRGIRSTEGTVSRLWK